MLSFVVCQSKQSEKQNPGVYNFNEDAKQEAVSISK
jgi:hypothetical protein